MGSNADCAIAIDLGGTRIKAGIVDRDARVVARHTIPTEAERGPDHVMQRIIAEARDLADEARRRSLNPMGVAVGAPGALSQSRGVILAPPNLPGWNNVPVAALVRERCGLPTILENDANAAALGEFWTGAGRGVDNLVLLTLGTGIGGGVVLGGRILRGFFETAGEVGHTIVIPDGRPCGCGQKGCLEAYASANSIVRIVSEQISAGTATVCAETLTAENGLTAEHVAEAAQAGDSVAMQAWDQACRLLAVSCVNVQHVLNPQVIVLGGGMSAAGAQLLEPVRRHFSELTWPKINDRPDIRLAALADDAGVIGAAMLVFSGEAT